MKTQLDEKQFFVAYGHFLAAYLHQYHDGLVTDGLCDAMAHAAAKASASQLHSELRLEDWIQIWRDVEKEMEACKDGIRHNAAP